jgi:hypothetical protein
MPACKFHTPDLVQQLADTERDIAFCAAQVSNPTLPKAQRDGALQGLADWLDNKDRILREMEQKGCDLVRRAAR